MVWYQEEIRWAFVFLLSVFVQLEIKLQVVIDHTISTFSRCGSSYAGFQLSSSYFVWNFPTRSFAWVLMFASHICFRFLETMFYFSDPKAWRYNRTSPLGRIVTGQKDFFQSFLLWMLESSVHIYNVLTRVLILQKHLNSNGMIQEYDYCRYIIWLL